MAEVAALQAAKDASEAARGELALKVAQAAGALRASDDLKEAKCALNPTTHRNMHIRGHVGKIYSLCTS